MRRVFNFIVLVLFAGVITTGCSTSNKKTSKNSLTIWESYNDEEHGVFMAIVDSFEKKTNIKINVQRIPFNGMEQKLLTALASRTNPDIARVDYAFVATLAMKKAAVPIDDSIADKLKNELVKAAFYSNYLNGKFYGIPDQTNCLALFYNKEIFKNKGIKSPPSTWDEFIKIGQKITDEKKGIYAFGMHNSLWWTFPFLYAYGAKFVSPDMKRCLLDSKEAIRGFSLKVDLYRKYHIEAGAWQSGAVPPEMGFQNKKYAMIFNGPWAVKTLKASGIDFGVSLIPSGPNGSATTVGGTNMVILNDEKKDIAEKFLLYLTSPEVQAMWADKLFQIPVNKNAEKYMKNKSPIIKVFMEQMKYAVPRPPIPDYSEIEQIFNGEMALALSGKKSPEKAMKDATERVNKEILKGE